MLVEKDTHTSRIKSYYQGFGIKEEEVVVKVCVTFK